MGNGNKVEMFIAICAVISSLAAVYIAWDQGRVMRAQQHGGVFPIIQIDGYATNNTTQSSLGLRVSNSGVGPALIESVVLEIGDQVVEDFGEQLTQVPSSYDLSWTGLTGRAMAPGEQQIPIDISWRRGDVSIADINEYARSTANWRLKICYCSVFDKCWQTDRLGTARAKSVSSCQRGETDIFADLASRPTTAPEPTPIEQPSVDGAQQ